MATDTSQIELDERQRQLLAMAADHLGMPWSEVFEKAIAPLAIADSNTSNGNGRVATPFEILSSHGLIGCIEGTPYDLSTNKKFMSGYGKNG